LPLRKTMLSEKTKGLRFLLQVSPIFAYALQMNLSE
jgi:hypothetical protein